MEMYCSFKFDFRYSGNMTVDNSNLALPGSLLGREISGRRDASGVRFGLIVAEFNKIFCERLLEGAKQAILAHGGSKDLITTVWVPGSYELPLAAQSLASSGQFDALVALGVLIKGDTDHYTQVANEACAGLTRVMLDTGIPTALGVIPAHNVAQVEERSLVIDGKSSEDNKGWEVTCAVMQMLSVQTQIFEQEGSSVFTKKEKNGCS